MREGGDWAIGNWDGDISGNEHKADMSTKAAEVVQQTRLTGNPANTPIINEYGQKYLPRGLSQSTELARPSKVR